MLGLEAKKGYQTGDLGLGLGCSVCMDLDHKKCPPSPQYTHTFQ